MKLVDIQNNFFSSLDLVVKGIDEAGSSLYSEKYDAGIEAYSIMCVIPAGLGSLYEYSSAFRIYCQVY